MKKTIALLFAALLAVVPLSAQATAERPTISISSYEEWLAAGVQNGWVVNSQLVQRDAAKPKPEVSEPAVTQEVKKGNEKALVIIDSYFDNASVCVALSGCSVSLTSKPASITSPANHGNGMVEVAKRQSPDLKIIAVKSANTSVRATTEMTTGDFIRALSWVNSNASGVGAVSISRAFNGSRACSPNTSGTAEFGGVTNADLKIKELIASLSSKGIPVFAATGNKFNGPVDYPACLPQTNSVGVGSTNSSGMVTSSYSFNADTDYFASAKVYSFKSALFGLVPNTTSAGNVAVAAKYVSGSLEGKFVNVLP
jgi:hypothetical protein